MATTLDMAFAMDCTSSMGTYIEAAKQNIQQIIETIVSEENTEVQFALVEYRDHPPQDMSFVTRKHDFTSAISTMQQWINACSAQGGGDGPESVADALNDILKLSWRENATKIAILISDAPPHGLTTSGDGFPNGCPSGFDPMSIVKQLSKKGITLYVVGCEPSITPYQDFFMALAYLCGGQYTPLKRAKALAQVIVGGAQEELSLDRWMEEVDEEIQADIAAGMQIDDEEMAQRVEEKLKLKGAQGKKLMRNNADLEDFSPTSKQYASCNSLADVRAIYKPFTGKPLADTAPMFASSASGGISEESYGAHSGSITTAQAHRMVVKSMARNSKK